MKLTNLINIYAFSFGDFAFFLFFFFFFLSLREQQLRVDILHNYD
jgi:hypothetical protein